MVGNSQVLCHVMSWKRSEFTPKESTGLWDGAFHGRRQLSIRRGKNDFILSLLNCIQFIIFFCLFNWYSHLSTDLSSDWIVTWVFLFWPISFWVPFPTPLINYYHFEYFLYEFQMYSKWMPMHLLPIRLLMRLQASYCSYQSLFFSKLDILWQY